jgi:CubicO group peptidase (beta-lactamase class C family)
MHRFDRRTFLASLTPLAAPVTAGATPKRYNDAFERQILQNMAAASVPGAVAGWVENGKLAWTKPFGVLNARESKAVTSDSIFQAASLTKQVTAYMAFALRDQGKLDFSRTLVSYVDDLPNEKARTVTISQILSHSSGFPNWRGERSQLLIPAHTPGERFQYSGEGYFYLQRIIEKVTGQSFSETADRMVFEPLGMKSTALLWMPEWEGRYAEPHTRRGDLRTGWQSGARKFHEYAAKLGRPVKSLRYEDAVAFANEAGDPPLPNWLRPNAAASMVTTANDYARFIAAAIRNAELTKPLVEIRSGKDWMIGWGPGWGVEKVQGRQYLWQWGDNGGYKNIVLAEPARGEALFVFTNGDGGAKVYDRIATHLTGHEHPALVWI